MSWLLPLNIYMPGWRQKTISFKSKGKQFVESPNNSRNPYLLSVCIWLECNVPVVVVCKLHAYYLGTVVILEQGFHFLVRKNKHTHTHMRGIEWYPKYPKLLFLDNILFTSTGVVSGTSRRMIMQRLWFGRTFSPFSSTWTIGDAVGGQSNINCVLWLNKNKFKCRCKMQNRYVHLRTSKMRSMSVVRTLIPSMLAIVQMGTNWSLSIWDIR